MRLGMGLFAAVVLLGVSGTAFAGPVNCKQVNKYLQTGRSVKDVAETMVVEESEVKKCQEEAAAAGGSGGTAKPAEEKKDAGK